VSAFDEPLRIAGLLEGIDATWWIAGGWAIDLALGRVTRTHSDVDVADLRRDQATLPNHLGARWSFLVVVPRSGALVRRPWENGERLKLPLQEVHAERGSWERVELLLQEASGGQWVYRRDARIRRPLSQIGGQSRYEIPAFAPEIALLYKAKAPRPRDVADLMASLPTLESDRLGWLRGAIELAHPDSPFLASLPSN
jgi:Aminoglycoside-2''-adenylyltransferase